MDLQEDSSLPVSSHIEAFNSFLVGISGPIFKTYLSSQLQRVEVQVLEEDEDDAELDDEINFKDTLLAIAAISRLDPLSCFEVLRIMVSDRSLRLESFLSSGGSGLDGINFYFKSLLNRILEKYKTVLFEHIHWLVLIANYVLSDSGDGETPMISKNLLRISVHANIFCFKYTILIMI